MRTSTELNRRNFLKASGLSGAAFILGLSARAAEPSEQSIENLSFLEDSFELTPFVIIEKTGKITIMNSKPEIGQGTWQAIPMIIAEELELGLDQYEIKQTSGDKNMEGKPQEEVLRCVQVMLPCAKLALLEKCYCKLQPKLGMCQ
jgi:isoquinoline 1-oxidoreductase beta subunit